MRVSQLKMKHLSGALVVALILVMPFTSQAQDVTGSSIRDIASSVVLIEAIEGRRGISSGTGTIVSAEGYIYTNRHVIEDGEDYAIYMLDNIREQPVLRYYATPTYISRNIDVDFAILKIDRDERGRDIDITNENLPFMPPAAQDAYIGDSLRIFGYPGIGDGYMVVTTGEVVSVQNGSIGGDTVPISYRTDAEISSGNSGGLAVNENGEFVGLPTWVVSEDRTAGRLAGILPLEAVDLMLAADNFNLDDPSFGTTTAAAVGDSLFTLVNTSSLAICSVFISPTTASDWGVNQLADLELMGGASFDFTFDDGEYDVLLLDCNGRELRDERGVNITSGMVATFDGKNLQFDLLAAAPSLTIQNTSAEAICYVFISPSNASNWGQNQLDEQELFKAGANRSWNLEANVYDILLQSCDGAVLEDVRGMTIENAQVLKYR